MSNTETEFNLPRELEDAEALRRASNRRRVYLLLFLLIFGLWFFDQGYKKPDPPKRRSIANAPEPISEEPREVPPIEIPLPEAPPILDQKVQTVSRVLKVRDVYRRIGGARLAYRSRRSELAARVQLNWATSKPDSPHQVEISKTRNFQSQWKRLTAQGSSVEVGEWKVGRNFWRVSRDGVNWSESAEVSIRPEFLASAKPVVKSGRRKFAVGAYADLHFQDEGVGRARAWVLEGSRRAGFSEEDSRTILLVDSKASVKLAKVGTYFFRVRSVNEAGEVSAFSKPISVEAFSQKRRRIPALPLRLARSESRPTHEEAVREIATDFIEQEETVEPAAKVRTKVRRETPKIQGEIPWRLTLEGGTGARFTSETTDPGAAAANSHFLGLGLQYQWAQNSVAVNFHSKVVGANATGESMQDHKVDFRYNRWWATHWNWLQLGWASGAEVFRNPGQTGFSPGYSILKTGAASRLGLGGNWSSDGEALVGTWFDGNKTFEFSGQLRYALNRELDMGVGYRIHLFEAGSESASPRGLPYREALGEVFSSLKISF